jgi:Glyoxalase-like domain
VRRYRCVGSTTTGWAIARRPVPAAVSTVAVAGKQCGGMSDTSIEGVTLDHVAHAVPRWQDVWDRYAVDLGAEWSSGGLGRGFAPAQLRFANGSRIEVLTPNDSDLNDFLQRFLATSGPGPHHMTFKVPDLTTAIERARSSGLEPIGIDRSDPEWLEAFLHPKVATGVVIQMAEASGAWSNPPPEDFPRNRRQRLDGTGPVPPAELRRVVHAVADLDSASALFGGLLGGETVGRGRRSDHLWEELSWGGPLGIRLVAPSAGSSASPLTRWLTGRTGRVHHLEFAADEPGEVPGAEPATNHHVGLDVTEGTEGTAERWVIGREANAGLLLLIEAR